MTTDPGFALPATPVPAAPGAAAVRAAYFAGSTDRYELPAKSRAIVDQASLQCCVSCALASATETAHPGWPQLAPMFHYHSAKYDRSVTASDGRMSLVDGLETLISHGVCAQSLHPAPYTAPGWSTKPSTAAYADGRTRRLVSQPFSRGYLAIGHASRVVGIRERLRKNRPVLIGFTLPRDYKTSVPDAAHFWDDASVPLSANGHCVLVFGYDDVKQALRVQDSQGSGLFDGGCWWMGYTVADSAIVAAAFSFT